MKSEKPSISAILEHYGATVTKRRGWVSMRCPFHDDTHRSATANYDENIFCCFACQIKGDGYTIIMSKEGVGFREAINIAKGILEQSGEVLPQHTRRSGSVSRRTRLNNGTSETRSARSRA